MNYCTKCSSYYEKPGTCNCFAATQPAQSILPLPHYPMPTWVPLDYPNGTAGPLGTPWPYKLTVSPPYDSTTWYTWTQ